MKQKLYFEDPVFRFIYSFHMPCLMLLSGFFFGFSISKPHMWKKRMQTLLVPIIVWSLIPAGQYIRTEVINHQLNTAAILYCLRTIITYFWFLWAILFGTLIVWLVHKFLRDNALAYVIIGTGLLFVPNILNLKLWIYMYPFFVTGYLWNLRKVDIKWAMNHEFVVIGILIVSFVALFAFYNTDSFIYTTGITVRSFSQLGIDLYRYAIGYMGSAMVIWTVYVISPKLNEILKKILAYCGRISLTIYIIDSLINSYVLPRLTVGFSLNYGIVLCETVIVTLFCVFIDWIIRKIPYARAFLLGNR